MEDQKIIALLFERSEQGMTELIAKYGKLLRRIAWNILGNALDRVYRSTGCSLKSGVASG